MTGRVQRDTLEFASGVVIGAALGMAAGSLLVPDRSPGARIRRRLGKRAGRNGILRFRALRERLPFRGSAEE